MSGEEDELLLRQEGMGGIDEDTPPDLHSQARPLPPVVSCAVFSGTEGAIFS